jgi:hypothetical protein
MNAGATGDCSKLYDDLGEHCPHANVTQVIGIIFFEKSLIEDFVQVGLDRLFKTIES